MTYATLLDSEGIASQYLAIIKPRRLADPTIWSIYNVSNTYVQRFPYGQVIDVKADEVVFNLGSSADTMISGEWFYDAESHDLFVNVGADPSTTDFVATYEFYLGTFDAHFNRLPLDSTSRVVYYEPIITKSPEVQASSVDVLFGFLPSSSTSITLSNITHILQEHLYDSSFNKCEIDLYHWLDELTTANVKLISSAVCGSITSTDEQVVISIFDNNERFSEEFRHVNNLDSFYSVSNYANLDLSYFSRPIRKVYGVVDSFIPVNIDYNSNSPSTGNNRTWLCIKPNTNLGSVSTACPASPASTTTRTYLTSADGFRVGDSVWIDSSSGSGFDEFVFVTVVNKTGAHYIEHLAVINSAAASSVIKRSFVGSVTIVKIGVAYYAKYGKHYDEYTDGFGGAGFTLFSTLEADLSMATLTPLDLVYCRIYGNKALPTLSASPLGAVSSTTGNLSKGVIVLYDVLKTYVGLSESQIDLPAFSAGIGSITDEVGFSIPELGQQNYPTFKEILSKLSVTLLSKIFLDDNKITFVQSKPITTIAKTIEDDEILLDSFRYDFDYRDVISDIYLQYAPTEVSTRNETGLSLFYSVVTATNDVAKYVHRIQKQQSFVTYHRDSADAQILATRLAKALGDRRGTLNISTKNRFFDTELGQAITLSRDKIAGTAYIAGQTINKNAVVVSTQKSLDRIIISLDDQKGIQDNQSSW